MLYIIPTPIGNLEDITLRAIRILKEVDHVLCEDTRTSKRLLDHYQITTPCNSFHAFNEHKVLEKWIGLLSGGTDMGLISDAGTPSISDPGFLLVRACIEQGIEVECLPGATAFVPALVNSGLPTDQFHFMGFLPHKKGRQTALKKIAESNVTTVLYESPFRIIGLLEDIASLMGGDRKMSISREITKKFEETTRGSVSELLLHYQSNSPKGEFVVVIEGIAAKKNKEAKRNQEGRNRHHEPDHTSMIDGDDELDLDTDANQGSFISDDDED